MTSQVSRIIKLSLQEYFARREHAFIAAAKMPATPPIFIVGPPRSGTTLLYQAITTALRTAYFANFATWYPQTPVAASNFIRSAIVHYQSDFNSDYGEVAGRGGPAEAQQIWKAWLGRDRTDGAGLSAESISTMRGTIAALQTLLDGPFIAKDISNCLRIRALDKIFPGCLFVRVSRDALATAQSILSARASYRQDRDCAKTENPVDEWLFIDSEDFAPFHDKPYLEQIANQVFHTENILEQDLSTLSADRILRIGYQDFCRDPRGHMQQLMTFAQAHGVHIDPKADIPSQFRQSSRPKPKPNGPTAELEALLDELYHDWAFTLQQN
jgi:hypothetical protein